MTDDHTDAFASITDDHEEVSGLIREYRESHDEGVARRICEEVERHSEVEQVALYPMLDDVENGASLRQRAELEHQTIANLVARVLGTPPDDITDLMTEITEQIEAHVEFEESELLPALRGSVDADGVRRELTAARERVAR